MNNLFLLDANVILRLFIGDDAVQKQQVVTSLQKVEREFDRGLISLQVLAEIVWIAEKYYELERRQYVPLLVRLLSNPCIDTMELNKTQVITLLDEFVDSNFEFTDLYLAHLCDNGGLQAVTFDKKLANRCRVKTLDQIM